MTPDNNFPVVHFFWWFLQSRFLTKLIRMCHREESSILLTVIDKDMEKDLGLLKIPTSWF